MGKFFLSSISQSKFLSASVLFNMESCCKELICLISFKIFWNTCKVTSSEVVGELTIDVVNALLKRRTVLFTIFFRLGVVIV